MKISHTIFAIVLPLILVACATAYQPKGFSGGYSEIQLDPTTVRVTFEGNGYSNRSTVESYLIYRAAEVTIEFGFEWFIINEREGETVWHPKYGKGGVMSTAVIKMHHGQKPEGMLKSYDARLVIATMGPIIKR